jgi:hypothetical protein
LAIALTCWSSSASSEGSVNLERLARDSLLRARRHELERAHVVEAVGELHEQHANVSRHRDEHLSKALRLAILSRREVHLSELGHPVDQKRHLLTEDGFDVGHVRFTILDDVVEQRRTDTGRIEPHVGDDVGDGYRVNEIRIPGLAGLTIVHPSGVHVGLVDQIGIGPGVVSLHLLQNIGEADHERGFSSAQN